MTQSITSISSLRAIVSGWRADGARVALVPTMGALHAGHMALVKAARAAADKVVVSIFVNPTQFGPNEDFHRYPRPIERDLDLLAEHGADAAWLPTVEEMYPAGFSTTVTVAGVSEPMDGQARPGHFAGVATVVSKLLLQVMPDVALFGEKDYQQLCVIRRIVADLNMPVEILGVPTMREADGLAMSSRNQYLSEQERAVAPVLYAALQDVAAHFSKQNSMDSVLEDARARILAAGFHKIDYLDLRDGTSLAALTQYQPQSRLLVAAHLGTTRLIDNIAL